MPTTTQTQTTPKARKATTPKSERKATSKKSESAKVVAIAAGDVKTPEVVADGTTAEPSTGKPSAREKMDTFLRNLSDDQLAEMVGMLDDPKQAAKLRKQLKASAKDFGTAVESLRSEIDRRTAEQMANDPEFAARIAEADAIDKALAENPPVVVVAEDVADAFGMKGLPGVTVAETVTAEAPAPAPVIEAPKTKLDTLRAELEALFPQMDEALSTYERLAVEVAQREVLVKMIEDGILPNK